MFDYLLKKAERSSYAEKNRIASQILRVVVGVETLSTTASFVIGTILGMVTGSTEVGIISFCFFVPMISIWIFMAMDTNSMGMEDQEEEVISKENGTNDVFEEVKGYGTMPHFSKMYRWDQLDDVISPENFQSFVNSEGKKTNTVKVSDDDKWVNILGSYYPIDLICGYNKKRNEIYAIDGTVIRLPLRGKLPSVSKNIEEFFESRGDYYTEMPKRAKSSFRTVLKKPGADLAKADWGKIRLEWERMNAYGRTELVDGVEKIIVYDPVSMDGTANTDIFERVLNDTEIAKAVKAVRNGRISITEFLNFDDYQNEYAVCNGVRLLLALDQTHRMEGIDFLFECLNDVDEAYFPTAIDLLKRYPKAPVRKKLEENARKAYEEFDVQELGGLLYLAKSIGYEIEYVEEIKENQLKESAATHNTVPGFEFDEDAFYGSEEALEFSPYAYQKLL